MMCMRRHCGNQATNEGNVTNNEIVFQAVERVKGSDRSETRKSLLTQEELQELQP